MHTHQHSAYEPYLAGVVLLLTALIYVHGYVRMRRLAIGRGAPWRAASFLLGLASIWVALGSRMAGLDHASLTAHMVQHLLLMTVGAPLIWLGDPALPLFFGLPERVALWIKVPMLCSRWVHNVGRTLLNPILCWLAASGALIGWHIPSLFMLALHSQVWHLVEQGSFLVSGLMFWWPVIQPWPSVRKPEWLSLVYLFLATLPCDILSGLLVFSDRVVYVSYLSLPHPFGFSALEDQQCAGALMWTVVTLIYLLAGTIIAARLLTPRHSQEDPNVRVAVKASHQSMEVA